MKKILIPASIIGVIALVAAGMFFGGRSSLTTNDEFFTIAGAGKPAATTSSVIYAADGDTVELTASIVSKNIEGRMIKMLAYNGSIPGPTIRVPQESEITLRFTNQTNIPTTLHSHGVRLANKFDGVPDVTQSPIAVGETFEYKIKFPDAGVFWYHPHLREDYAQELGLYGNFLVTPKDNREWPSVNREVPIFLDDILLDKSEVAPFGTQTVNYALSGRYGNVMLTNGATDYRLEVMKGEVVRLYFTNSANTRVFNVGIPGAAMKLIGGDGGLYAMQSRVESVILGPSERAIIDVYFPNAGIYQLIHTTPKRRVAIGTISVGETSVVQSYRNDFEANGGSTAILREADRLRAESANTMVKRLAINTDMHGMQHQHMMHGGQMMGMGMMMEGGDAIEWEDNDPATNAMSTTQTITWKLIDEDTGKENDEIQWSFKKGDAVRIRLFNDPLSMHPMQHPIHIHGQRFLVLSANGINNSNPVWKDTVIVGSGETLELLVEMSNPGTWMFHCHIPEHLESGMMFGFTVSG